MIKLGRLGNLSKSVPLNSILSNRNREILRYLEATNHTIVTFCVFVDNGENLLPRFLNLCSVYLALTEVYIFSKKTVNA